MLRLAGTAATPALFGSAKWIWESVRVIDDLYVSEIYH